MTEEEAREKACCGPISHHHFAKVANPRLTKRRDDAWVQTLAGCIGSRCMAWRWYRTHINNPADPTGDLIPATDTHGYCGLAGHWFEGQQGASQ